MAEHDDEIIWPTQVRRRLAGGVCVGVDKSLWLIRSVPMSPVTDANSEMDALSAAVPLYQAFGEIAQVTPLGALKRRRAVRGAYREIHLLLVNIPRTFHPPRDHPNYAYMRDQFGKEIVQERVLLLAVKLRDKTLSSGGVRAAIDFVAETLLTGQVPIEAYEQDKALIGSALARAGLSVPTEEQLRVAENWWTLGDYPDVPSVAHSDHMHFFDSPAAARSAADAGLEDCTKWPRSGSYAITFASVADFDLPFVSPVSDAAQWVVPLLNEDALAISIRARIEPAIVTKGELKRQSKRYLDDMVDRANKNKDTDYDQIEQKGKIDALRDSYSLSGAAPVLTETSILVAFSRTRDINNTRISNTLDLRAMSYRHQRALSETMLCSPTRANPYLHDLPAETVACSGIVSRTIVGDKTGVLVGFTELDRQPAWLDTKETGRLNLPPTMLIAGGSGSGKLLRLSTPIPTPSGWTTMGDLRVGDRILSGDGKPCSVTFKTDVNELPDLYAITFSDGQVVYADYDHQWLVSAAADRKAPKTTKRATAIVNWEGSRKVIEDLWRLADQYTDDDDLTVKEISEAITGAGTPGYWSPLNLRASLSIMDAPSRTERRTIVQRHIAQTAMSDQQVALVPAQRTLLMMANAWAGSRRQRSTTSSVDLARAAWELAAEVDDQTTITVRDLVRMFGRKGISLTRPALKNKIERLGIDFEHATRFVPAKRGSRIDVVTHPVLVFSARIAFKALAERISQSYGSRPSDTVQQRRLTTGEMLAEGVRTRNVRDEANFHINVPDAIELPEATLVVDPYVLGAWLGDGGGVFTQGASEACTDSDQLSDQAFLLSQLEQAGFQPRAITSSGITIGTRGLHTALRTAGVLKAKHIPTSYLRGSVAQRLALLQGLMDTDGTIDSGGCCELSLCDRRLADGALELIRSLGIKCSMTSGPATITEADPDRPGHKRRRVTSTRYRMRFTTTKPVFRLPRKAVRLPQLVRETQKRLYIESIEPVATEPGACITVDSPNHTYLVQGFIPTSNTQALLHISTQIARSGRSVVLFDPKADSDHSPTVLGAGGIVASLDDLVEADGAFDPIRFTIHDPRKINDGLALAASTLSNVNPWGGMKENYETGLRVALKYGVDHGATCTGQALQIARDAGECPREIADPVLRLARADPMFRACVGMDPKSSFNLRFDGLVLVKVGGASLELPDIDNRAIPSQGQRIGAALVRLIIFGSAAAVANKGGGTVVLDEAWIFLQSGLGELARLARLARSQDVMPILATQKITDAVGADFEQHLSRGLLLHMDSRTEVLAACELFGMEPTEDRIDRFLARAERSGTDGAAMNWDSLQALIRPGEDKAVRGSVGYYCDVRRRNVPVEIKLNDDFLRLSSTRPEDIARRDALRRAQEAAALASSRPGDNVPATR